MHRLLLKSPDGRPLKAQAVEGIDSLRLDLPGVGEYSSEAHDLFECLIQIRRELEPLGYRFLVNGARRNVWPSGMSRDMGGGRDAYVLTVGTPGRLADLVDIFEPADESEVATVEEQESFFRTWVDSVLARSRHHYYFSRRGRRL